MHLQLADCILYIGYLNAFFYAWSFHDQAAIFSSFEVSKNLKLTTFIIKDLYMHIIFF